MWNKLPSQWKKCFELAWKAFCIHHVPVGALITDHDGQILSMSYNGETSYLPARISHAEMNALLKLPKPIAQDIVLYTSLEPCVMCFSALFMALIKNIRYSCRDPHAGGTILYNSTRYFSSRDMNVLQFNSIEYEFVNVILHMVYEMNTRQQCLLDPLLVEWSKFYPWVLNIDKQQVHYYEQKICSFKTAFDAYNWMVSLVSSIVAL